MTIVNLFLNIAVMNTVISIITLSICNYYLTKHLGFAMEIACYIVMLGLLSEEIVYYYIAAAFHMYMDVLPSPYIFVSLLLTRVVFTLSLSIFMKLNHNVFIFKLPYKYWAINIMFPLLSMAFIYFFTSLHSLNGLVKYQTEYAIMLVTLNVFLILINNAVVSDFYRDTSLMQKQIELYIRHIQAQDEQQGRIRKMKHDLKSTIIMILDLLENDNIEDAKARLNQQLHKTKKSDYLLQTGVSILDSILNYRAEDAFVSNIKLVLKHDIKENITIDPFEIGYILGNLIDNAMEAVNEMKDTEDRTITIKLDVTLNIIYIMVVNPYDIDHDLTPDSTFYKTQKEDKDNHGLGISIIESIVKSHKGKFTLDRADNKVTASIYMYQDI